MAQAAQIEIGVSRLKAIGDLKAIRKELKKLTKSVGKLNTQWVVLGSVMTKGTKATTKAKSSMGGLAKTSRNTSRQVRGLSGRMRDLSQSATLAIGPLSGVGARLTALSVLFSTTGLGIAGLLVAFVALGIATFKGAVLFKDYEVALAKIAKTTNLTDKEVKGLGRTLRKAAVETGISRESLLGIAEAAGRLGIDGVDNLETFAITMGMVATATDLTGEQAATSFARILKVTGESVEGVKDLANVIVRLGNNVAAEESEITEFATAVARATGIFGVSAVQAAGLGAVFAEFGQKSEASATALNKVFGSFGAVLAGGGRALNNLEQLTGSTAASLQELLKQNPTDFFLKFAKGLNQLSKERGTNAVVETLKDFGIAGVREAKALLPLIDNVEELARVLALVNDELSVGDALAIEFGKRQNTLQGDIDKLKEAFDEFLLVLTGEDFNQLLRSITQTTTKSISGFTRFFEEAGKAADGFTKKFPAISGAIGNLFRGSRGATLGPGISKSVVEIRRLRGAMGGLGEATEESKAKLAAFEAQLAKDKALEITTKFVFDLTKSLTDLGKETEALLGANNGFEFVSPEQVRALAKSQKMFEKLQLSDIPGVIAALDKANLLGTEQGRILLELAANWDGVNIAAGEFVKEGLEDVGAGLLVLRDEAKKLADALQKPFDAAASNFVNAFRNAFKEAFDGNAVKSILSNFANTIKSTFTDLFADILTQQLTQSLIAPLFKQLGTGLGFSGGALDKSIQNVTGIKPGDLQDGQFGGAVTGVAGALTGLVGVVNDVGKSLGFFEEVIDKSKFTFDLDPKTGLPFRSEFGTKKEGTLAGDLLQGFATSQVFGGKGFLANAVGTIASTVLGKVGKKLGEAAGKAVGGSLGKALGPLGSLLGGLLGGLIGKLFSKDPQAAGTLGAIGGGAGIGTIRTATQGKGPPLDQVLAITNTLAQVLNKIAVAVGGTFTGVEARLNFVPGKSTPFSTTVGGTKQKFASAQEAQLDLVKRFLLQGGLTNIPPAVLQVIRTSLDNDLETLFKNIEFAIDFENAFGVLDGLLTDVEKSVKDLNKAFDESVRTAKKLGLAESRVNDARALAILQLRGGFEDDIKGAILALTDPLEAALFAQAQEEEIRLKDAMALGASTTAVLLLGELERQKIIKDFANSNVDSLSAAFRTIQDFLTEITATTSSKLPLTQVLAAAQSRFTDLRATFLGGDTTVADALVDASRQLLDLSRLADASGPGFFSTQALVEDTLRAALLVDDGLALDELQLAALNAINSSIDEGNAQRAALIAILTQPSGGEVDAPQPGPPGARQPGQGPTFRRGGANGGGGVGGSGSGPGAGTQTVTRGVGRTSAGIGDPPEDPTRRTG